MTDLIGSQKDMVLFTPLPSIASFVRAGQLRAIAVASKQRVSALPDTPTFIESGIAGYEMDYWYGLMAPIGTPVAVRNTLHNAAVEVLGQPEMIVNLAKQGFVPTITTQEDFAAFVKTDMAKWAKVVKSANLKPEQ